MFYRLNKIENKDNSPLWITIFNARINFMIRIEWLLVELTSITRNFVY